VVSTPLKKYLSDWIIIPTIGENKKCSKPPTSYIHEQPLACFRVLPFHMDPNAHWPALETGKTCGTSKLFWRRKTGISPVFIAFYDLPRVLNSRFRMPQVPTVLRFAVTFLQGFLPGVFWPPGQIVGEILVMSRLPQPSTHEKYTKCVIPRICINSPKLSKLLMKSRHLAQVVNQWIHANQLDHHSMFMSFEIHLIIYIEIYNRYQ
jgi:hypothetical protein